MRVKNIQHVRLNGKDATIFDVYDKDGVKQNTHSVVGLWHRPATLLKKLAQDNRH